MHSVRPTRRRKTERVFQRSLAELAVGRTTLVIAHRLAAVYGPFAGDAVRSIVRTVAFPGLGTGIGRVGPNTCARQVREAIQHILLGVSSFPQAWPDSQMRHQLL